jgi:hypothetical protein
VDAVDDGLASGGVEAVGAGDDGDVGAADVAGGFAQEAAWEGVAVVEGQLRVEQDDVEVAGELPELKAVVEDENVDGPMPQGLAAGEAAVLADDDGDAGAQAGEEDGFVAGVGGIQDYVAVGG